MDRTKFCTAALVFSVFALFVEAGPPVRVSQACEGSTLELRCNSGFVIDVEHVILADSKCFGTGNCCPGTNDCTSQPSEAHRRYVLSLCNGRPQCSLRATREMTSCRAALFIRVNNDYEQITYYCVDVDECSVKNPGRKCHINAACLNTQGSFTCQCNRGYVGNGYDCQAAETSSTSTVATYRTSSEVMSTEVSDSLKVAQLQGAENDEVETKHALSATQVTMIVAGVLSLVLLLLVVNMVLWCRLKQQRRRRRVSEKQLELTLRRGASASGGGGCGLTQVTSLTGGDEAECCSSGCSIAVTVNSRPTAVVRAVEQRSNGECGNGMNSDAVCCSTLGRIRGIESLPSSERHSCANQYEKLDHLTIRKPKAIIGNVEVDYRLGALPPVPISSTCSQLDPDADENPTKSYGEANELDLYDDLDEYLKPVVE